MNDKFEDFIEMDEKLCGKFGCYVKLVDIGPKITCRFPKVKQYNLDVLVSLHEEKTQLYCSEQFQNNPDVGDTLYKQLTSGLEESPKRECPFNLNDISRDDVIQFFNDNEDLKEHLQKVMDCERHDTKFKRHFLALNTRDVGLGSPIRQGTNIAFMGQFTENEGENVDIKLIRIARKIVKHHTKIGQEQCGTQEKYAEHVIIPEGMEQYLIHKFDFSEVDANYFYKSHHVYQCSLCPDFFNDLQTKNDHFIAMHEATVFLEEKKTEEYVSIKETMSKILKSCTYQISAKRLQEKYKRRTKSDINLSHVELKRLIKNIKYDLRVEKIRKERAELQAELQTVDEIPDFD